MDALGANVFWCQAASAAVLTPVGYVAMSNLTYRSRISWFGFLRYAAALLTNFPVALLVLWFTHDLLALPMWLAAPFQSGAMFCWNYLTSTWALSRPMSAIETVRG
jgi:putative flippase GtrA